MRNYLLGALFGAGVTATAVVWFHSIDAAQAQQPAAAVRGGDLLTHQLAVDEHRQQLTVVDPQLRTACVYHIARDTGEISLKSVRHLHWDLQMMEFNCTSPRPREIRAMLEHQ